MSDKVFYISRFICIVIIVLSIVCHYMEIRADINQNKEELKRLSDKIEYLTGKSSNGCKNPTSKFP